MCEKRTVWRKEIQCNALLRTFSHKGRGAAAVAKNIDIFQIDKWDAHRRLFIKFTNDVFAVQRKVGCLVKNIKRIEQFFHFTLLIACLVR